MIGQGVNDTAVKPGTRLVLRDQAHWLTMTQRFVTPADSRSMPWKNGGGATLELAAAPAGATLDDFVWRASIATIERGGPFSNYPGVDRTLVFLAGTGMRLRIGADDVEIDTPGAAVTFAGEAPVACELESGPTRDFNFMVRRQRGTAEVSVINDIPREVGPAVTLVCHAFARSCTCVLGGQAPLALPAGHTLVADGDDAARGVRITPEGPGALIIVAAVHEATR